MPRRRASALVLVLAATAALSVLVFAYLHATRGRSRLVHRVVHAEAAYHLALSGVDAMLAHVAQRMQPGNGLDGIREGLPAALDGHTIRLDGRDEPLAGLIAWLAPEVDARVRVTATFRGWRSIYPAGFRSPAGAVADPTEKSGLIEIVASATCGNATREVECLKAARIVRPVLPLLARFTLFVKQPPERASDLALLDIEKRALFPRPAGRVASGATHDALVLQHAAEPYRPGALAKAWLDRAGWVHLGGDGERRWVLDLAFGGGAEQPLGEAFLLGPPAVWIAQDRAADAALDARILADEVDRLAIRTGLYASARTDGPLFARLPLDAPVRAGSLHLFGTEEHPSPTVVLGRAYRRSLVHAYLATKARDRVLGLPFVHASADARLEPLLRDVPFQAPPLARERVVQLFGDRHAAYARAMSRPLVEPYARGIDHLEKPDAYDPPYALVGLERVTRRLEALDRDRARTFLYAVDANARARVLDPQRRPVFEGDLSAVATVDLLLPERTTYVFGLADFRRWTERGHLTVRGVLALDPKEPDLAIDRPLEVDEGGVIVVRGNIDITAPIVTRGARPLTLVALEGRIRVGAPRVDAFLVALGESGAIERSGDGELALTGGLAATRLDVPSFARGAGVAKRVVYDPRADAPRGHVLCMDGRRVVVVR